MATETRLFDFTAGVEFNRNLLASDFPDLQLFGTPFIWQHSDLDRLVAENNGSGLLSIARFDGTVEPGAGGIFEAEATVWGGSGAYAQVGPALVDELGNGYWLRLSNLQRIIIARLDYNSSDGLIYYNSIATVESSGSYSSNSNFKLRLDPATGLITGVRNGSTVISFTDTTWSSGLTPGFAAQQGGAVRDRGIYTLTVPNAVIEVANGGNHTAQQATGSGTGTVSAPYEPLKSVAAYNDVMRGYDGTNVNGVKRAYVARIPYTIAGGPVSRLVVSFSAPYLKNDGTTTMLDLPNSLPIESAALELDGVTVPVTFFGGVFRDKTILGDDVDYHADEILPSAFGLTEFTPGQKLYVRVKFLHPAGVDGFTPFSERRTESDAGAQYLLFDPAATTESSVDAAGPFTTTGTVPTSQTRGYSPILLGEFVGAGVALVARGDSITVGEIDDLSLANGNGWFQRMAKLFTTPPATLNLARSGSKSAAGTADSRLEGLYKYAHAGVIFYGTNDFGATGTDALTVTVLGNVETIISRMRGRGVGVVGLVKLPPRTTGTFATEAGQTVPAGWGAGGRPETYNAALDTGSGDFVVPMDSVRGTNVYKWAAGTSADGVHPNATGHALMAEEAAPLFAANVEGLTLGADGSGTHQAQPAAHSGAGVAFSVIAGAGAHQAPNATQAGTGEREIKASGAHQAQQVQNVGAGERVVTADSSVQAAPATSTGTAERVAAGTGSHQAQQATHQGSGSVGSGNGWHQAARATGSGLGEREALAGGSHQAQPATQQGTGGAFRLIEGSGTHQAPNATQAGTGERTATGSGAHAAVQATGTGTGLRLVTGSGEHQAGPAEMEAAGSGEKVATGNHKARRATHYGEGLRVVTGSGSHKAKRATGIGGSERLVTGTGEHQAQPATGANVIYLNTGVRIIRPRYTARVL